MKELVFTLSNLLNKIKWEFDTFIWYQSYLLEVEIKSVKKVWNFFYFDLIETSKWKIVDSARANIFNPSIVHTFLRETRLHDIEELEWKIVLVKVNPSFHRTYNFSLNIIHISSEFFIWKLEKKKKEDIEYLNKLGLLNKNAQKDTWFPTFNIAVITWEKSEWYRDFETILVESGYKFQITKYISLVQWEKAREDVWEQLLHIQEDINNWIQYNLVAIIRWWGWSEWMNWTNDLKLCQLVCNYSIPLMSAIWHTVDQSILDIVSKYDCKTPSEAANILINIYNDFSSDIQKEFDSINQTSKELISNYREDIEEQYEFISNQVQDFIANYKNNLQSLAKDIPYFIWLKLDRYKRSLSSFMIEEKLKFKIQLISKNLKNIFDNIESNNPKKILNKGYNILLWKDWLWVKNIQEWNDYFLVTWKEKFIINIIKKL